MKAHKFDASAIRTLMTRDNVMVAAIVLTVIGILTYAVVTQPPAPATSQTEAEAAEGIDSIADDEASGGRALKF